MCRARFENSRRRCLRTSRFCACVTYTRMYLCQYLFSANRLSERHYNHPCDQSTNSARKLHLLEIGQLISNKRHRVTLPNSHQQHPSLVYFDLHLYLRSSHRHRRQQRQQRRRERCQRSHTMLSIHFQLAVDRTKRITHTVADCNSSRRRPNATTTTCAMHLGAEC